MRINVARRPNRSVGQLPSTLPSTVPYKAEATATPCIAALKFHKDWIFCSAPEMTTVSNPNKNPARADVADHSKMRDAILPLLKAACCSSGIILQ